MRYRSGHNDTLLRISAVHTNRNMAASAQQSERRAFHRDRITGLLILKEGKEAARLHVLGTCFNGQRTLSWSRTEIQRRKALLDPLCTLQPLQSSNGHHNCIHLSVLQLA